MIRSTVPENRLRAFRAAHPAGSSFALPGPLFFLPQVGAALVALGALLFPNPEHGLVVVGASSVVFTLIVVWRRGGHFLSPSGVFFLAAGIFVGVAAWFLAAYGSDVETADLRDAAVVALLSTIATEVCASAFAISWRSAWPRVDPADATEPSAFVPPRQFVTKGLLLVLASRVPFLRSFGDAIAPGLGMIGVMMLVLAFSSYRRRITWVGDALIALAAFVVPLLWLRTIFEGGGRILVAGVLVASLVGWSMVRPGRWQKVAVFVAIPVFLLAAGYSRVAELKPHEAEFAEPNAVNLGVGLESVYVPMQTWAEIVSQRDYPGGGSIGPRYGATFVNTALLPVPRDWWPSKPKGFGAELTELLRPSLVPAGHSMGALSQGEWYANFGYWGLGFMALVLGWILARLDRWHIRLIEARFSRPTDWWEATVLLCIVSSLGEIAWAGSFSFFNRGGFAALMAWLITKVSVRRTAPAPSTRPIGTTRTQVASPARVDG